MIRKEYLTYEWNNNDTCPDVQVNPIEEYVAHGNSCAPWIKYVISVGTLISTELMAPPQIDASCRLDYFSATPDLVANVSSISCDINFESRELIRLQLIEDVRELERLCDNWDGYGASHVSSQSVGNVIELLYRDDIKIENISDIYANVNGFLSIEWENKKGDLVSLEIGRRKMAYFTTFDGVSQYYNKLDIKESNIVGLIRNLEKL